MGEPIPEEPSNSFLSTICFRCSSCFPCFGSRRSFSSSPIWWDSNQSPSPSSSSTWRTRGVGALMKIREWSEIAAGPKWKTFIRRFNRTHRSASGSKFQYDPMSYALNFDEGQPATAALDFEQLDTDLSSRYAAVSASSNNSLNYIHKDMAVVA